MLSMEKIGKSFSGVRVLDNVRFDLKPGEVHVLAGELNVTFECYDSITPEEIEGGTLP